jgi:hypothetical protein
MYFPIPKGKIIFHSIIKKKISIACILIYFTFIFLTSCKKYEDGPFFTLKKADNRLEGSWILTGGSWHEYASEKGLTNIGWTEEFSQENEYKLSYAWNDSMQSFGYTITGRWEWIDNKDGIEISANDSLSYSIIITKLTSTEFNYTDNDYSYELSKRE